MRRHFQEELEDLYKAARSFAKKNPALAKVLGDPGSDPDVLRLFEGMAFLNGLVKEKISDEFPKIVHDLLRMCFPQFTKVIPSMTVLGFTPKPSLTQTVSIPAGTYINSVPVDKTMCKFKTCWDVEISPIKIINSKLSEPFGRPANIEIFFEVLGGNVAALNMNKLRFFLSSDYRNALNLYSYLSEDLSKIIIKSSTTKYELDPKSMSPVGFLLNESILEYPLNMFYGYNLILEYFIFPQKFLFFDIKGLKNFTSKDEGPFFEIILEFSKPFSENLYIDTSSFSLFSAPALNLFPHEADPVIVNQQKSHWKVRPSGLDTLGYQVFSIDKVSGIIGKDRKKRVWEKFHGFEHSFKVPIYNEILREGPDSNRIDIWIEPAYPTGVVPEIETLSFEIQCTNGPLPHFLAIGDICISTDNSPEFAWCSNLTTPTHCIVPDFGTNALWKLLSHLALNYISISSSENLKALLQLYIPNQEGVDALKQRVNSIQKVTFSNTVRSIKGIAMHGTLIDLQIRPDYFLCPGDYYLFTCVLEAFLGNYAALNTFTKFSAENTVTGIRKQWPEKIGIKTLL